ncbi:MAG: 3,4-dihydroxy-2-butanone-4-phosphate synthase [Alphaproteobacteria bacterium]
MSEFLSSIEDIIKDAKAGRMFILVDDEDRENEGDLVIPAQFANKDAVNFMAKHGRGLICLAMTKERVETLGLNLMARSNGSRHQTAFTVSIEAREGVSTGISAADRALTIATAIDPAKTAHDIVSPGHVFPLVARNGGVLVRAGHTEAAVDISRLAGLNPSGVICEIMNDDGSMARMPDLIGVAKQHSLKIATIADLIAYRRKSEKLVQRVLETPFTSKYGGEFTMLIYTNTLQYAEHVALVKGAISPEKPTLVRVHKLDVLRDVLGDSEHGSSKQKSLEIIAKEGGVLLLIREPSATSLTDTVKRRMASKENGKGYIPSDLRDYGIGAQILLDLGVRDMILMTSSDRPIVGLEGYGLKVVGKRDIT